MSQQSKKCDACGALVTYTGHRGFGPAHTNCPMRGKPAADAEHPPCPTHGWLVWAVGPYSTFRTCYTSCTAGKRGKPYRFCAPRGEHSDTSQSNTSTNSNSTPNTQTDDDGDTYESESEQMDSKKQANGDPNVAAAIQALMGALQPKSVVDPSEIQKIVDKAVDAKLQASVKVTLVIERKEPETKVELEHPHPYLARVIKLVDAGLPVYLWGPAGGGKTTAGMQVARSLGRESEIDTLDPSTFRSMVQGYMTPDGEPVHTSFTRCWSKGQIYIADECDNAPGHVQTLFNSALANGHAPLAWANVNRGEGFAFVGTGNTPGRPTREFPDRKPMSAAFADRLYFVHWPLDEQSEREWTGVGGKSKRQIPTTAARKITANQWVDFVQNLREWAQANAPTLMITPRASLTGLKALACGETPEQVADGLIFRGADSELRTKALAAVRLP